MIQSTFVFMKQALRQDTRFYSPSLMRLGILVITLISLMYAYSGVAFGNAAGLGLIWELSLWNLFIIGLLGIPYFSSVITEEKEAQTIGLLRMTGIRPVSLLLGKSIPRQLNAVLILSVQFPFTLLAITLGGVLSDQVVAVYCSLLSFLIMIANICLFSSVFCHRSRSATWFALIIILVLPVSVWATGVLSVITGHAIFGKVAGILWSVIPIKRVNNIFATGFSGNIIGFQVYSNLAIGAFFFLLSWLTFNIFVKSDAPGLPPARGMKQKLSKVVAADGTVSTRRNSRVWDNAIRWKEFYFTAGGTRYFKLKLIIYPLISAVFVLFNSLVFKNMDIDDLFKAFGVSLQVTMIIALFFEPAISAAKLFRDEINWKTYPSLYMLPLSINELVLKKIVGSLIGLLPAIVCLIAGFLVSSLVSREVILLEILEALFDSIVPLMIFTSYIVFLALTLLLSLVVKRGAIPLAAMGMCFIYFLFSLFMMLVFWGGANDEGFFFMIFSLNISLFAAILYLSRMRLISLAASGE